MTRPPRLALFEFGHFGHRPYHLALLIKAWKKRSGNDELAVVVTPRFAAAHADVLALAAETAGPPVRCVVLSDRDDALLATARQRTAVPTADFAKARLAPDDWSRRHWEVFNRYAAQLRPAHSLLMYLDAYLLPIAMAQPTAGAFSGIFFRPSYHYPPAAGPADLKAETLQKMQERFLIARMLKHPSLSRVFCLDPTFVAQHRTTSGAPVLALADPIELPRDLPADGGTDDLRARFGIESGRKAFLFFGALDDRKGTWQLLAALKRLPDETCRQFCLLLVGTPPADRTPQLQKCLADLAAAKPLQIVTQLAFVTDAEMWAYFRAADAVLAVYQRHVGMSGISLWAAAFQKPLLTQDYGVLGALAKAHRLGQVTDTTDPEAIAAALTAMVAGDPQSLCDRAAMQRFAESNDAAIYSDTLYRHLL